MPSESEAQRRLFALADAVKSGKVKASAVHGAARRLAKTQSHKTLREFMHKKHDAPERVEKESAIKMSTPAVTRFGQMIRDLVMGTPSTTSGKLVQNLGLPATGAVVGGITTQNALGTKDPATTASGAVSGAALMTPAIWRKVMSIPDLNKRMTAITLLLAAKAGIPAGVGALSKTYDIARNVEGITGNIQERSKEIAGNVADLTRSASKATATVADTAANVNKQMSDAGKEFGGAAESLGKIGDAAVTGSQSMQSGISSLTDASRKVGEAATSLSETAKGMREDLKNKWGSAVPAAVATAAVLALGTGAYGIWNVLETQKRRKLEEKQLKLQRAQVGA